jgi:hypothetical protein
VSIYRKQHNLQLKATALKVVALYKLSAFVVKVNCSLNVINSTEFINKLLVLAFQCCIVVRGSALVATPLAQ